MTEKRTSIFENGLIWFGAGVSLAEILTGTYFASLGFGKGLVERIDNIGLLIAIQRVHLLQVTGLSKKSRVEKRRRSTGSAQPNRHGLGRRHPL